MSKRDLVTKLLNRFNKVQAETIRANSTLNNNEDEKNIREKVKSIMKFCMIKMTSEPLEKYKEDLRHRNAIATTKAAFTAKQNEEATDDVVEVLTNENSMSAEKMQDYIGKMIDTKLNQSQKKQQQKNFNGRRNNNGNNAPASAKKGNQKGNNPNNNNNNNSAKGTKRKNHNNNNNNKFNSVKKRLKFNNNNNKLWHRNPNNNRRNNNNNRNGKGNQGNQGGFNNDNKRKGNRNNKGNNNK